MLSSPSGSEKLEKVSRTHLLASYHRCRARKLKWEVLRKWRHQAKYGRITAMFSRNELIINLVAQKDHCRHMEKQMNICMDQVNDLAECLQKNDNLLEEFKGILSEKETKIKELKLSIHNAEQEIARLQSTIDCVEKAHPALTRHIIKMQPKFGFRERNIEDYAKMRASDMNKVIWDVHSINSFQRMQWAMNRSKLRYVSSSIFN